MKITINPDYEKLVPRPFKEEYEALKEDIHKHGQFIPIVVTPEGVIVDGHTRFQIAKELGRDPEFVIRKFSSKEEEKDFVYTTALLRRDLTYFRKAVVALEWAKEQKGVQKHLDNIARLTGISKGMLHRTKMVKESANQEQFERLWSSRESSAIVDSIYKEIVRTNKRKKLMKSLSKPTVSAMSHEDFVTSDIPPNSIDCIVTDPPYPKKYIYTFGQLATFAAKVLKPGGSLATMSGQAYLPEVFDELLGKGLTYQWTFCLYLPGGQSSQIWKQKLNTFWKPVIWLTKGEYSGEWHGDFLKSEQNEKGVHSTSPFADLYEWQQSVTGTAAIINAVSEPGQMILDPMMGTGTTGVAAILNGRSFRGMDIDPTHFEEAQKRVADAESKIATFKKEMQNARR